MRSLNAVGFARNWVLLAAALMTLAGCAASPGVSTLFSDLIRGGVHFDRMLEHTTKFQGNLLEDGEVTDADLERAFDAQLTCVENEGFPGVHGKLEAGGASEIGVVWGQVQPTEEMSDQFWESVDRCEKEYFSEVVLWYMVSNPIEPEPDPYTAEHSTVLAACMDERKGFRLNSVPSGGDEWYEVVGRLGDEGWIAFRECEGEVSRGEYP